MINKIMFYDNNDDDDDDDDDDDNLSSKNIFRNYFFGMVDQKKALRLISSAVVKTSTPLKKSNVFVFKFEQHLFTRTPQGDCC